MGYYVNISLQNVCILAKNVPGAIKAMLQLMGEEGGESSDLSPPFEKDEEEEAETLSFSRVNTPDGVAALKEGDFEKAIGGWGYSCRSERVSDIEKLANLSEYTNIKIDSFYGEKWGNDESLWLTLAPFIEPGGIVEMHGEDDAYWRFVFNDGKLTEQQGHIEWE